MDLSQALAPYAGVIEFLIGSKFSIPLWGALALLMIFAFRRSWMELLWRNLHLIEDLVLEKEFLSKIDMPLRLLLLSLILTPFIPILPQPFERLATRLAGFVIPLLILQLCVRAFDLLVFGWWFGKHNKMPAPAVFRVVTLTFIWAIFLLVFVEYSFGINLLPLIATSTVATAVLGLAMQDTLKNLFAGLTISLERRFQDGDWVSFRLDGNSSTVGEVSEIGWRTTRLRTLDDNYAVIPNVLFTSNHVTNFSRPLPCYARSVEFPVRLDASPELVTQILLRSVEGYEHLVENPAPEALAVSVKTDCVVYRLRFWIDDFVRGDEVASAVIQRCLTRMQEESIVKSDPAPAPSN